jgi:choline dehydrogenase
VAGPFQPTCRDGRRCSTADTYLRPALQRPNLEGRTGGQAKVRIERCCPAGMTYRDDDIGYTDRADLDVLVAGL